MKIVRIIARLNVGGPARHVTWLTEALDSDGFESVLVAGTVPEGEQDMGYFAAERGVRPVFVKEMSRELSLLDAVSLWKVFRILREEKPDIVHTHTAKAGTIGRVAGLFYRLVSGRRVAIVHTYHGHVFHSYYGAVLTSVFLNIERVLARFTDRIVTISEQQREEVSSHFKVGKPEQFEVIGLGIDSSDYEAGDGARERFRAEFGFADDDFVVGFVGRLTAVKNLPMLLEAASILRNSGSLGKLRFAVIGDGALRGELEAEAAARGLSDVFVFTGHRTDAGDFYSGLDAVALTSLNEGTPLSIIEGMAAGRPVISTAVGGVIDLFGRTARESDGFSIHERGISVVSGDAESFAAGIARLLSDEDLSSSMAAAASAFVAENYGKDRLVSDMKDLYRRIAGGDS